MRKSRDKTYIEKLRDPRWQRMRLEVLKRDEFKCVVCGAVDKELQLHHTGYVKGDPWDVPDYWLATLCVDCHAYFSDHKDDIKELLTPRYGDLQDVKSCLVACDYMRSNCADFDGLGIAMMFSGSIATRAVARYLYENIGSWRAEKQF